ncbi:hypothetical protein MuYL_1905 [Mucilaginibacter xinganensis]|uniref:Uncharacterized protein n=1 Tax=Mucilaginibacter xinganensis TaxID=1234841 RepID=A0A223NW89_9SPHI|nr:hypothetical protein MuYL_1905 [Mucilaginibacter xinganensis]
MNTFFSLLIDPLDHAFTGNIHQWLTRKAGRGEAGRNDAEDFHLFLSL